MCVCTNKLARYKFSKLHFTTKSSTAALSFMKAWMSLLDIEVHFACKCLSLFTKTFILADKRLHFLHKNNFLSLPTA